MLKASAGGRSVASGTRLQTQSLSSAVQSPWCCFAVCLGSEYQNICLSSCFSSSQMMATVGLYHVGSEEVD